MPFVMELLPLAVPLRADVEDLCSPKAPWASICRLVWSCMKRELLERSVGGGGEAGMLMV